MASYLAGASPGSRTLTPWCRGGGPERGGGGVMKTFWHLWEIARIAVLVIAAAVRWWLRRAIRRSSDPEFYGIVYQD